MPVERLPCRGRLDALRAAHQQRDADVAFELRDLLAQRRLRDEQFFGRFPEAPVFHDADKVTELTDVHGRSGKAKVIGYPYDRHIQTVFPLHSRFT